MILYITRKFPPSIGGMQRFNFKLVANLREIQEFTLISWGGNQIVLPIFLIIAFVKALYFCITRPVDCIYVSDGLLAPLGYILKRLTKKPVAANIHGRDIAFSLKIYQLMIPWALRRLDKIICVSEQLKQECVQRNIPEHLLEVIPNGVDINDFAISDLKAYRDQLQNRIQIPLQNRKIILTVGRLIPKKGIDSFIENILPLVIAKNPQALYFIVGEGPLQNKIQGLIEKLKLENHAVLLGKLAMDSGELPAVYNLADIFVMPNIPVDDDMEGFGIVAIEACACALPVIASKVDGILQAVKEGENGFLIDSLCYENFADKVLEMLDRDSFRGEFGLKAKQYVETNYSWKNIAQQYSTTFHNLTKTQEKN